MNLASCKTSTRGRLVSLGVDPAHTLRLQELGVRPGAEFFLTNRAAFGVVVVNIAGARIAVDSHSARLIEVETLA
ncbi:ferrous iron transport protein A [Schaalia sp. 19OD2882]|uniref:FeoA family protein n=1 Tax=Schaalia sp. 19OD2882 TaxID=2794089 RepID=UPI001C1E9ED4|nr:FeoA family protein [Schaalia sp. 19OD2882]QWW19848.1 ferrous iron transport protein A [Schaalia sp. 19OD2882]